MPVAKRREWPRAARNFGGQQVKKKQKIMKDRKVFALSETTTCWVPAATCSCHLRKVMFFFEKTKKCDFQNSIIQDHVWPLRGLMFSGNSICALLWFFKLAFFWIFQNSFLLIVFCDFWGVKNGHLRPPSALQQNMAKLHKIEWRCFVWSRAAVASRYHMSFRLWFVWKSFLPSCFRGVRCFSLMTWPA